MRPAARPTSTYTVSFGNGNSRPAKRAPKADQSRVARTLALAHRIDVMIRNGQLKNLADAARAVGITRARMTQIMKLVLLAPRIQEAILESPSNGSHPVSERALRQIAAEPDWTGQIEMWDRFEVKHERTAVLPNSDG